MMYVADKVYKNKIKDLKFTACIQCGEQNFKDVITDKLDECHLCKKKYFCGFCLTCVKVMCLKCLGLIFSIPPPHFVTEGLRLLTWSLLTCVST